VAIQERGEEGEKRRTHIVDAAHSVLVLVELLDANLEVYDE
jgi:hypothetical protein